MLKSNKRIMKRVLKTILSIALVINVSCTNTPVEESIGGSTNQNASGKGFDSKSKLAFTERYYEEIPGSIAVNEKFRGGHPEITNYVFVKTKSVNLRERPGSNTKILGEYHFYDMLKLIGTVNLKGTTWYKVESNDGKVGYVYSGQVEKRVFQFEKGLNKLIAAEQFVKTAKRENRELAIINSYRPDPNNNNNDKRRDKYGTTIDQNIEGTYKGETIFVPDRSVVEVISRNGNRARIKVASIPEPYLDVDSRFIRKSGNLDNKPINKAVIVDIENQNIVVYEKIGGEWTIISYVRTKTGQESTLGFETPRGNFLAHLTKFEMLYNGEIGEKQGYAKYATRFSGGGYLHGTPMGYEEEINKEYFLSLKEWTLGKYSGTRKCLRTDEDHAKFVFEWVLNGKYNKKHNNQIINDNVLFVVF